MKRKHASLLALIVVLLLTIGVFTGCGKKEPVTAPVEETKKQTTLTFSVGTDVPTLDPQLENSMASMEITNAIHEGLLRLHDGKAEPGMAEKWDISDDGKTYTFHLRDAKWSDGQPVTAKDFEYGIKRLLNPKTAASYAFAGFVIQNGYEYNSGSITDASQVGVKAIDDKTLEIKLVNPASFFLGYTSLGCFMPTRQDLVEKFSEQYAQDPENMVYNGPFILKEWKHEEAMTLVKNPDYWNKDAVKLETVSVLTITDRNTALSMYESGELDFVGVPTQLAESYITSGQAKVYMNGALDWLRINTKAEGKPWFGNMNFRKALNLALNREEYVKSATKNLFFPATRLVLPMVAGAKGGKYTDETPIDILPTKGDAAKAKEYLAKAMEELKITDPKTITMEIKTSDDDASKLMAEVIQDQISRNLGITVTIKLVTYKQKLADDTSKQYDTVYNGWMPDYDDPLTYMELFESTNSQNSTGWANAEYDRLIGSARSETDAVKRQQMFWDAEKILIDELPLIPLQCRQVAFLQKANLKGVSRYFVGSDLDFVYAYFE